MQFFGKSDQGFVRKNNEDSFLIKAPLFAVADGMGGHAAGEIASRMAMDYLSNRLDDFSELSPENAMKKLLEIANKDILHFGQINLESAGLGTTVTAVYVVGKTGYWAHCGDSRLYLCRSGVLKQITEDHSLVEELVRGGVISRSEADVHPRKNMLTRALGADAAIDADTGRLDLVSGDRLLLCTDGLTNMVNNIDICRIITQTEKNIEIRVNELIDLAKISGGVDNITAIIIEI
ncbi:MAG: Stp1/IreP family PP2C-type Ser/Thr phosphatase [Negativicutes bacterium]|jgi:protein phosphatase